VAIHYYDDLITQKLIKWIPEASNLSVLHPDETKKLFELTADARNDKAFELPHIALSRRDQIELLSTTKNLKSYDGLKLIPKGQTSDFSKLKGVAYQNALANIPKGTYRMNVIPIRPEYQLDIFTKTAIECEEYVRNLVFKLINNPLLKIEIPYNDLHLEHTAYIRLLSNIANTSAISERIFSGQFTRWTLQFELHDAFLFSIPYRKNWRLVEDIELELSHPALLDTDVEAVESINISRTEK
jgi:hypothetical protein